MCLLSIFALVSSMVSISISQPVHTLFDGATSAKLEHATIQAVFKNSTSEYKFMFPNIPSDEIDPHFNSKFPLSRPILKENYSVPKKAPSSVDNVVGIAEEFSKVKIQLQRQEVFKSFQDLVSRTPKIKSMWQQTFDSVKRKFSLLTTQDAPPESLNSRTPDDSRVPLKHTLGRAARVRNDQLGITLSPEEMEEISENGRLCTEDGECIDFADGWGNNCCPFG